MAQVAGVVLLVLGVWLLAGSPWALVVGGVVLLVAPEVGEWSRRRRGAP